MKETSEFRAILSALRDPAFDRVLVACHRSPDGDACGSAYALAYALRKTGKQARVFCPDPFGKEFESITAAEKELSAFEPAHFVTVDVAAPEMLSSAPFADRIDIVIDHHRINTVPAPLKLVDPQAAACGEIIWELVRALGVEVDAPLARMLYTAVSSDTGCFRYSNTSEHTFLCAAALYRAAEPGEFWRINKTLFETRSHTRLRLESYAAQNAVFSANGRLALLSVTLEKQKELGAVYEDLDILVGFLRTIEGVEVAVVLKEKDPGVFKVSVRSEESFDASRFCAFFGGGGHLAAAGCTLTVPEEEAVRLLCEKAKERLA